MNIKVRAYNDDDIKQMNQIWNEVVRDGMAFPQEDELDLSTGKEFFSSQTYCGVAENDNGELLGLYILHPNNIGRVGHIGNASYAVNSKYRNQHVGEKLVLDSLEKAKESGFRLIQFNAVVKSNESARHLYERLGFNLLGIIPGGFRNKENVYEEIYLYYFDLTK